MPMSPFVGHLPREPHMKVIGVEVEGVQVYIKVHQSDPTWVWWWFRIETHESTGNDWTGQA